ncbi:MAG: hypothetical protein ACYTG1_04625 [Planctomycetota bacterium]|jgi:hypothetical protein
MIHPTKTFKMTPPDPDETTPRLDDALRWAIDSSVDPAMASADWLAMDIHGSSTDAVSLLTDSAVSLVQLRKAKSAYKTMRIVGETSSDRRLGARLYAASIAAGLVWHGKRISRQSDEALRRAFKGLLDDKRMPESLRSLAGKALCVLEELP